MSPDEAAAISPEPADERNAGGPIPAGWPAPTGERLSVDGATLTSRPHGTYVVVGVTGEVDVFNAARVMALVEAAVPSEAHGAVLDLSGVGFLDSTGIRKLFALVKRLRERRQRVDVVTPEGSIVLRTLELVEFARAAPMHDSLEDALSAVAERG